MTAFWCRVLLFYRVSDSVVHLFQLLFILLCPALAHQFYDAGALVILAARSVSQLYAVKENLLKVRALRVTSIE